MSTCTKFIVIYFVLAGFFMPRSYASLDTNEVIFYTPYARISVPPGESVDYSIDVINNTREIKDLNVVVSGLPGQWSYTVKSGGWNVRRLSVLPDEKQTANLNITVPLRVKKGRYDFNVWDGVETSLPLSIYVSEEGTFKTEFSTEQANMEGQASSTFTFNATLMNQTAEKQLYAFRSQAPRGWNVAFKVNYKQVTSTEIEANTTQDIPIEIHPPDQTEAGTYNIPVIASTTGTNAKLNLEVVITGSYDMELTTPTGLVSSRITAGSEKRLELTVRNTGSSELKNIRFSASKPRDWEVVFEPETLLVLMPGNTGNVHATVKAPRKTIAGDYVTNLTARTPEVTKEVAFRISVRTPILIGWLGVLIIIAAVGVVYYLFRKYGRR